MPRYLIDIPGDPDGVQLRDDAFPVAWALAMGADIDQFDVDPIEAAALILFVQRAAEHIGDGDLLWLCSVALAALRPVAQAFAVLIEHTEVG